jgi:AcrR family transcriptional regulator
MITKPRNAERTRTRILDAARRLFAEQGIDVSLRDIAAAAGVSHGLIQQYFGARDELVAEIIKREIDAVIRASSVGGDNLEQLRVVLRERMDAFRDFAVIIMRAELAGIAPEKMIERRATTPAMHMASLIAELQAQRKPGSSGTLDPKLVSAYINAALFGFATMAPWLMTSVGLRPKDYEKRKAEIVDITLALIQLASGASRR